MKKQRFVTTKKFMALSLAVLLLLSSLLLVNLTPRGVRAEEDTPESWSFYRITSAAANYMSSKMSPDNDVAESRLDGLNQLGPGGAGLFLGYPDPDSLGDKLSAWLASIVSRASLTYSYESIRDIPDGSGEPNDNIYTYARYGYLLNALGFDQVAGMTSTLGRQVVGIPFYIGYSIADSARGIMSFGIKTLETLNPFKLLAVEKVVTMSTTHSEYNIDTKTSTQVTGSDTTDNKRQVEILQGISALNGALLIEPNDPLYPLASFYSTIYQTIYGFSWAIVIPVMFAIFMAGLLLKRDGNKMGRFKRYVLRIGFIVLGVPILGVLYTTSLASMGTAVDSGASPVAAVVGSTFVDFGSWANHSNLKPYQGTWFWSRGSRDVKGGMPSDLTTASIRQSALTINIKSGALNSLNNDVWTNMLNSNSNNKFSQTFSFLNAKPENIQTTHAEIQAMLSKYYSGVRYDPATKETEVKRRLVLNADDNHRNAITAMFKMTSGWSSWEDGQALLQAASNGDGAYSIFHGGLDISIGKDSSPDPVDGNVDNLVDLQYVHFWAPDDAVNGLSDIAMYNYLNSSFGPNSVTVYSPNDSSSLFTRDTHYAVNMIGRGMVAFALGFNSFVTLLVFGVLGWGYAILMIFKNIKRTFTFLVSELPWAMLGGIRAIGQSILTIAMMILEVIMTIFLYVLLTQFMYILPTIVGQSLYAVFGEGLSQNVLVMGWLLSGIFLLVFMFYAFKIRKDVIKGVDEGMAELVRKFTNTDSVGTTPDRPGALARGLAAGAGMAVGNRMMNGGDGARPHDSTQASGQQSEVGAHVDGVPGADGASGTAQITDGGTGSKPAIAHGPGGLPGGSRPAVGGPSGTGGGSGDDGDDGTSMTNDRGQLMLADGSPMESDSTADFNGDRAQEMQEQRDAQAMMEQNSIDAEASQDSVDGASDTRDIQATDEPSVSQEADGSDGSGSYEQNVRGVAAGVANDQDERTSEQAGATDTRGLQAQESGSPQVQEEHEVEETSETRQSVRHVGGQGGSGQKQAGSQSGSAQAKAGKKQLAPHEQAQGKTAGGEQAKGVKGQASGATVKGVKGQAGTKTPSSSQKTAQGQTGTSQGTPTKGVKGQQTTKTTEKVNTSENKRTVKGTGGSGSPQAPRKTLSPMAAAVLAAASSSENELLKSAAAGAGMAYAAKTLGDNRRASEATEKQVDRLEDAQAATGQAIADSAVQTQKAVDDAVARQGQMTQQGGVTQEPDTIIHKTIERRHTINEEIIEIDDSGVEFDDTDVDEN